MTTSEIVREMTQGQLKDIAAALIGAIPGFPLDEIQTSIGDKSSLVARVRETFFRWKNSEPLSADAPVPETPSAPSVPPDNVPFPLEVDNGQHPMGVVISIGFEKKGWKYLGPKRTDKQVYPDVRLVHLGYVTNLEEAQKEADKLGCRFLEGQAGESFKVKYPKPDREGPIIFGGAKWQSPHGSAYLVALCRRDDIWKSLFRWSGGIFRNRCRWAVVNK